MPESDPPVVLRHQVLADPTGRRRRRLTIAGRIVTGVLGLWLIALLLGGLGLQPLAGLPIVGSLGTGGAAPPALPVRVQAAVATRTTIAPATPAVQSPATNVPAPSHHPTVTSPSPTKTRPPAQTTPATAPGQTKTNPGRGPTTNPSTTAPGQTKTPPGQTKTGPGPPTTTPGKNPAKTPVNNGKVKTP